MIDFWFLPSTEVFLLTSVQTCFENPLETIDLKRWFEPNIKSQVWAVEEKLFSILLFRQGTATDQGF